MTTAIEPSADEIERVKEAIADEEEKQYGGVSYEDIISQDLSRSLLERRARAAILAMDRRAEVVGRPAPQLSGISGELPAPAVAGPEGLTEQASKIITEAWPHFGGNHQTADFWNDFGEGVQFTLKHLAAAPEPPATRSEEPIGYVDRLSNPGRISPAEQPGLEMPVFASPPAVRPEAEILNEVRTPITIWMKSRMADELNKLGIREGSYDLGQDILTRVLAPEPPATAIRALKEPGDEH